MARPLRINIADGWYHCMNRGIDRRALFTDDREYRHFLSLLGETVERFRFRIHAYCLLGNHFHVIIQTPDANLSQGMQWLGLAYSSWFNARHQRVGPLFQGRFKSVPVENSAWAYELSLYVHLNPIRTLGYGLGKEARKVESAGLSTPTHEQVSARLKALREYPWSSYRSYAGHESGVLWLSRAEILRRSARRVDERQARYREDAREIIKRGVDESRLETFREVLGIGGAEFLEKIKALAGEGGRETERCSRLRERATFAEVVHAVASQRGEPNEEWMAQHGDWGKWMVLKLARLHTGLTLKELGQHMGGTDYSAICMGLKRFDRRLEKDRKLKKIFTEITQMLYV